MLRSKLDAVQHCIAKHKIKLTNELMMRTALQSSSSVSLVPMQARTLGRCLQEFQETLQLYQSYGLS